jgi:hypothetical protein
MKNLTLQDFDGRAGTAWEVPLDDGAVPMTLQEVQPLPGEVREGAFRLVFVGPGEPLLPQAIYPFRQGDDAVVHIFIVPVGRTPDGVEYEAIFN